MTARKHYLVLLVCCMLLLPGCRQTKIIRIGFVAELSGRNAVLGVQGRNGAQMAVDEINASGGVAGQMLELMVRDNMGEPDELLAANRELIDSQVVAMTGHPTSWETVTAFDLLEREGIILFSPTTSTPALDGLHDHFFRLIPSSLAQSQLLAEYLYHERSLRQVVVIYDLTNAAFAETFADGFSQYFRALGGQISIQTSLPSAEKPDYAQIVSELRDAGPADTLLVVASSIETALLAQQVRKQNWPVQIASSNWAYTGDLLPNGGRAVEGILISAQFNSDCQQPAYLAFKTRFEEKYGSQPAFVAVFSYETMVVLARALEKTSGKQEGLADAIAGSGRFQGLCDQIVMDEFGDVQRSLYLVTVQNGAFKVLKTIEPAP